MLANNLWKLIGNLIEMSFAPFEALRLGSDSWWGSNIISWIFIGTGFIALFYWMSQMFGFKKNGKEDSA
jgi:hypothetical protein